MDPDPHRQHLAALLPDAPGDGEASPGEHAVLRTVSVLFPAVGDQFTSIDDVAVLPPRTILRDRHAGAWQIAEGVTCDSGVPYMQRAGSHIHYPLHPDYQARVHPAWERLVPLTVLWSPAPPAAAGEQ